MIAAMTFLILLAVFGIGLVVGTFRMVFFDGPRVVCPPRSHHGDVFETHTFV
jgi:hypothetical protein